MSGDAKCNKGNEIFMCRHTCDSTKVKPNKFRVYWIILLYFRFPTLDRGQGAKKGLWKGQRSSSCHHQCSLGPVYPPSWFQVRVVNPHPALKIAFSSEPAIFPRPKMPGEPLAALYINRVAIVVIDRGFSSNFRHPSLKGSCFFAPPRRLPHRLPLVAPRARKKDWVQSVAFEGGPHAQAFHGIRKASYSK